MKLSKLLEFDNIVLQLHDSPDADAVGSGYAIYTYLIDHNKKVRLVYSGNSEITKSNMVLMLKELEIPVEYVYGYEPEDVELLVTIDCQYGEGNVGRIDARNIAMIDHHNTDLESNDMVEIRSHLVSCATVCYSMLLDEGYDINANEKMATALYYGMYMDSNGFSEIRHPLERDMMDYLMINNGIIKRLVHSNFTVEELETAGIAMIRHNVDDKRHVSYIKANPCDPNILGIIGDMVLQVDSIHVSIVYNECPGGYKLSVRSCEDTVAANDIVSYICDGVGNGGGHLDKAGGFISRKLLAKQHKGLTVEEFMYERVRKYYSEFEIIYSKDGLADKTGFVKYAKKHICVGYIKSTAVANPGEDIRVRTLEGDVFITASEDLYIMIGAANEVYPIEKKVFEKSYDVLDTQYIPVETDYKPSVCNMATNELINITGKINSCQVKMDSFIYAKQLDKCVKVFTKWNYERYMIGKIGDYICYRIDDDKDIYVVDNSIFIKTYELF